MRRSRLSYVFLCHSRDHIVIFDNPLIPFKIKDNCLLNGFLYFGDILFNRDLSDNIINVSTVWHAAGPTGAARRGRCAARAAAVRRARARRGRRRRPAPTRAPRPPATTAARARLCAGPCR